MADFQQLLDDINSGLQAFLEDSQLFPVAEELPLLPREDTLTFARTNIDPPGALLLSSSERIRVSIFNAVSGQTVAVAGRLLRPDGTIRVFNDSLVPTSDRVRTDFFLAGYTGALLSFHAGARSAATQFGSTFVQASIVIGADNSLVVLANLFAGFTTGRFLLSWPTQPLLPALALNGTVRAILGTDPAAGAEVLETVPTGAFWELLSIRIALVTDATVSTRVARLALTTAGGSYIQFTPTASQTASLTRTYNGAATPVWPTVLAASLAWHFPPQILLIAGSTIQTLTNSIAAGDDWGPPLIIVKEWVTA